VDEGDDSSPAIPLRFVPQSRAPGRDASLRRYAGHFRHDQSGASGGTCAVMHEVPVADETVGGAVLGHRRYDDPVLERHAAKPERQEHRSARTVHSGLPRQLNFDLADVRCIANPQILVPDTLTAGQKTVGELPGFEVCITRDVLEPLHAIARRALQLEGLQRSFVVVVLEPGLHVRDTRHMFHERYGIFHRELGARADAEMRRVRRVADQHDVAVMPARAQHAVEIEPRGAAQVAGIAHQRMTIEVPAEKTLTELDGLIGAEAVETVRLPGLLACLHDHRGERAVELIGMDLKPAVLGLLERERERRKLLRGAEPDEPAFPDIDVGTEDVGIPGPGPAVDAVRRDDQIRPGVGLFALHFRLERLQDAEIRCTSLQDVQQRLAFDAAETVSAGTQRLAAEMHRDVIPVIEAPGDGVVRLAIDLPEPLHGLVREHHAPAEGVVRAIALDDFDCRVRQRLLEEDRGIQPRRAAAETNDPIHGGPPGDGNTHLL
jgi:hypothetical protein